MYWKICLSLCFTFVRRDGTKIIHLRVSFSFPNPRTGEGSALGMYVVVLIIRCIFLQGISAISVAGYSNSFTSLATEHALDDVNPTAGSRPAPVRNLVDKIDVKDLIETLQNTFRRPKSRLPVAVSAENNINTLYL